MSELRVDTITDEAGTGPVELSTGINVTSGNVGIGATSPASKLQVNGDATTAEIKISSTSDGGTAFDGSEGGLSIICGTADTTNKYTPAIKFGSTDANFTTTNPKFGAAIVAEAAQDYSSDTNGGMDLSFWTSPINPGTGNGLVERIHISAEGNVGIGTSSPDAKLVVDGQISGKYTAVGTNVAAQALATNKVSEVIISSNTTLTTTVPPAGSTAYVIIQTSGATSRTVTFGTGFNSTGTLATGTASGRRFVVSFVSDGTRLLETSRTTAITV
jgi:hypothetical protein